MGRIRYKYPYEHLPAVEDIAACFRELTGLTLRAEQLDGNTWELSASPLRGAVEVERAGNILWVIPDRHKLLLDSYFMLAMVRVLHRLGTQRPPPRVPRFATRPWAEVSPWRRWLHR